METCKYWKRFTSYIKNST